MEYTFYIIKKDGQYLSSGSGWHWNDYLCNAHFFMSKWGADCMLMTYRTGTTHEVYLKVKDA